MFPGNPPEIPAAVHSNGERILGLIPDVYRWTRWGGKDRFNLIITNERLIFDFITGKTVPWDDYNAGDIAKTAASNRQNLVYELRQIESIRLKSGENVDHSCGRTEEIRSQLYVQTTRGKQTFYLSTRYERTIRDLLLKAGISFQLIPAEPRAGI